jgi:prevent-host-death family protein
MRDEAPETRAMKISDIKATISRLINEVHRKETRVLIEKGGIPVAALVSVEDLRQLVRLDAQRAERRRVVAAMREPFRSVSSEEIERETAQAVAEVREEMRAERDTAAARR